MSVWTMARNWLRDVPVTDAVDRRNAPYMQILLVCMGCLVPVNKAIYLLFTRFNDAFSTWVLSVDVATDAAITVAAWFSLYLIRRGLFRQSVRLYLAVMLGAALVAYATIGMEHLANDPFPLLLLGLAGLMLGRRALWIVLGVLLMVFAVGTLSDMVRQTPGRTIHWHWGLKTSVLMTYLLVAVLLDRTIAVLSEALRESNCRRHELVLVNQQLEHEMFERERAQNQLVHAQKMEAVGRACSGVVHDFDNVLNVVLGYAMRRERLADRGTQALVTAMEGVELAARRALAISRKLLNFSRQDEQHPEVFDAVQVVRDIEPMLRQMLDVETRLLLNTPPTALAILLDRAQFELMVLNIAANACDAMTGSGSFSVDLRGVGDEMELRLRDSGDGMPQAVQQRIFEPFYTTKPLGRGTGLGLSVVHDLVTAAGGRVEVQSALEQGTEFRIYLPLAYPAIMAGRQTNSRCHAR